MRDITEKQFLAKCEKYGFETSMIGVMGYVTLSNKTTMVNVLNSGSNKHRDWLAYLIQEDRKHS